jgi:hypothetical protein
MAFEGEVISSLKTLLLHKTVEKVARVKYLGNDISQKLYKKKQGKIQSLHSAK